jgi:hypothetical protein
LYVLTKEWIREGNVIVLKALALWMVVAIVVGLFWGRFCEVGQGRRFE